MGFFLCWATTRLAALAVFWHTGNEPATLTACVFGVCGLENGVMGWIKTTKERQAAEAAGCSLNEFMERAMDAMADEILETEK